MIKGNLSHRSNSDWNVFMDKLIEKKKKKEVRKKIKIVLVAVVFVFVLFISFDFRTSKPSYIFAKVPLKNSQQIVVENGSLIEVGENDFIFKAGDFK